MLSTKQEGAAATVGIRRLGLRRDSARTTQDSLKILRFRFRFRSNSMKLLMGFSIYIFTVKLALKT